MSTFKELYHQDVSQYVEQLGGANYLSWARAWALVKEHDENAKHVVHEFPMMDADFRPIEGVKVPYLKTPEGYQVRVSVTINGNTETESLPVMDNKRVPLGTMAPQWVKGEGKAKAEKKYAPTPMPTTFDLNNSTKRCLVKAIGLHGLGLYLYEKEDSPREDADKIKAEIEAAALEIREFQKDVKQNESAEASRLVDKKVDEYQARAGKKIEEMDLQVLHQIKALLHKALAEAKQKEAEQKELEEAVQG